MANIILRPEADAQTKLWLMQEDAMFDVADDDSACIPDFSSVSREINARIKSRQALPKVPKAFLANGCVFNCAYCTCRASRDCRRYENTPRELAELTVRHARAENRGIFLSSAIVRSPDYTQELMIETLRIIRGELGYTGYVHAKVMPGADPLLIEKTGLLASRMSVNIEVAKSEGYKMVAKNKNKENILAPMRTISALIARAKAERRPGKFAVSQTTQLMAGSSGEDDKTILTLSGALYKAYRLSRVYYTAFNYSHPAVGYDHLQPVATPAWRMARLYQADRLMQLYGFTAEEITPDTCEFLEESIDPKSAYALRNPQLFPVEINTADYEALIRVPGIGIIFAKRIIAARRIARLSKESLLALGVSFKRCGPFITCMGKPVHAAAGNPDYLRMLLASPPKIPKKEQIMFDFASSC